MGKEEEKEEEEEEEEEEVDSLVSGGRQSGKNWLTYSGKRPMNVTNHARTL